MFQLPQTLDPVILKKLKVVRKYAFGAIFSLLNMSALYSTGSKAMRCSLSKASVRVGANSLQGNNTIRTPQISETSILPTTTIEELLCNCGYVGPESCG
jgi:hypothetical protein